MSTITLRKHLLNPLDASERQRPLRIAYLTTYLHRCTNGDFWFWGRLAPVSDTGFSAARRWIIPTIAGGLL